MKPIVCVTVCLGLIGLSAEARQQIDRQREATIAQSRVPRTEQVNLGKPSAQRLLTLALADAVRLAVENNPSLKVEKIRVEQARTKVNQEEGGYNPVFTSGSVVSHKDNIVASRFYPTGLYTDLLKSHNLGVETRTRTGGRLSLTLNYGDLRSNSNTQTLSPQYSTALVLSFSHSLLRDFGRKIVETRIRVAEKGVAVAESNLFSKMSQLIQRVEETYWSLTFLQKDLEGRNRSLDNARGFLTQNENLLRAGRVAQVSVLQSRAAVAEREQEVIASQTAVEQYKDRLKNLLWLDLGSTDVVPSEESDPQPPGLDPERSLLAALERRHELEGLRRELEQRELELNFAENQKRPRLDLNGQFGVTGLSGKPSATCVDPTSVFCIPVGSNVSGSILAQRTGVRDAWTSLVSANPYENWSVELKLQIPIGNDSAKAQYAEASLRRLETSTNLLTMREQIAMEVRGAIRDALAAQKRIDASHQTVIYVEDQLAGMRQQLEAGLVSSYDVLKVFDEVDKARTTELQAMMDFNVALSRVRLADASGLQRYKIELAEAPRYNFAPGPTR